MNGSLKQDLAQALCLLEEDGSAALQHGLGPELVHHAHTVIDQFFQELKPRSKNSLFSCRFALERLPALRTLLKHPVLMCLQTDHGFKVVRSLLLDKHPKANWKVSWHQDQTVVVAARPEQPPAGFHGWSVKDGRHHGQAPAAVLDGMITLRMHFDACSRDQGSLSVIPGSQREGVLSDEQRRQWMRRPAKSWDMPEGGMLLMKPLLLHASSCASDAVFRRRVLHLELSRRALPAPLEWGECYQESTH